MSEERKNCNVEDIVLTCADGIQIAAQRWTLLDADGAGGAGTGGGSDSSDTSNNSNHNNDTGRTEQRILCLHGWLDNCRSYYRLAPLLVTQLQQQKSSRDDTTIDHENATSTTTTTEVTSHNTTPTTTIVVAIDFPGHGKSSHKSIDGPPQILSEFAYYVAEVIAQLGWDDENNDDAAGNNDDDDKARTTTTTPSSSSSKKEKTKSKFTLIGHSMGCAVSIIYAACYPQQISNLILLEGFGPRPHPEKNIANSIRKHITTRMKLIRKPKPHSIFNTIDDAVKARCMTATTFPGKQYISTEAAYELVSRATTKKVLTPVTSTTSTTTSQYGTKDDGDGDDDESNSSRVQFLHDNRLYWPSLQYMTSEQNRVLYETIQTYKVTNNNDATGGGGGVNVCVLTGKDGWPFDIQKDDNHMKLAIDTLQPSLVKELPGSHHFHVDPTTCEQVAESIVEFLQKKE